MVGATIAEVSFWEDVEVNNANTYVILMCYKKEINDSMLLLTLCNYICNVQNLSNTKN